METTESIIQEALEQLRDVQFCDNTHTEAIIAREEVAQIIRALASRLTRRAPDLGWACACGATNAQKLSACGFCDTPRPSR